MTPTDRQAALDQLGAAYRRLKQAETQLVAAVAAARSAGATWDQIGQRIGQHGPNAHRKYAPHITP